MKSFKLIPILLVTALTSCGSTVDLRTNAPKYDNNEQFITFGYSSPTDGTYTIDGITYSTGVDYRTKERYEEYKNAGLNTMMIQRNDPYRGDTWATSQLKKEMDLCVEAGISRCIITDERLYRLTEMEGTIWGTGVDQFENEAALKEFVKDCMKDYAAHPVFYGVLLVDEPRYTYFEHVGAIYKAIKSIYPDCYIQENLLPYTSTSETTRSRYCKDWAQMTATEAYTKYVNDFIDATKCEKILMDSYPIHYSGATYGSESFSDYSILVDHISGLEILSDICKEKHIEFDAVAQSCSWKNAGNMVTNKLSTPTFQWQMNMYMAFGVKKIGYFTYWRKQANSTTGEWFNDDTAFMSQDGKRTDLYYSAQTVIGEMQKFAPTILSFELNKYKVGMTLPLKYSTGFLGKNTDDVTFTHLKNVGVKSGFAYLSTEMIDSVNNRYMYSLINPFDPDWERDGTNLTTTYDLTFSSDFNAVAIYYRGEQMLKPLTNSSISIELAPGYAAYVIPYKA